jgi:type III secretory pathway component EscR
VAEQTSHAQVHVTNRRITMNVIEQVTAMYNKYLGRNPEQEGLDFWVGKIESGHSVEEIDQAISQSEEALAYNK